MGWFTPCWMSTNEAKAVAKVDSIYKARQKNMEKALRLMNRVGRETALPVIREKAQSYTALLCNEYYAEMLAKIQ